MDFVRWDFENWGKTIPFAQLYIEEVSNGRAAVFGGREEGLSLNGFEIEYCFIISI